MSMTREEAIKTIEFAKAYISKDGMIKQALDLALAALRGPTREMVERIFPGCKMCKPACHKCKSYPVALYPQACKTCVEHSEFEAVSNFCEDCGRPLTDEALGMMLKRLEELYK